MANADKPYHYPRGPRVTLRAIEREDLPALHKGINDPEVNKFLNSQGPISMVAEETWFNNLQERIAAGTDVVFAITVDGKLVGNMGLHGINYRDRTATTGSVIFDKELWGKGIAPEAKMLVLHYAFNNLNLRKINSVVFVPNRQSARAILKCGYKVEGLRRQQNFVAGEYVDEIVFGLLKDEWLPIWEEFRETGKVPPYNGEIPRVVIES